MTILFIFECLFIFERESASEHASRGGAVTGGQRISSGPFPNSSQPEMGLRLRNHEIIT